MLKARNAPKTRKIPAPIKPQRELMRLRGEVSSLRRQLRQTQRLASIGTIAVMIAHEFNNILTPVINYAQLARKKPEFTEKALNRAISGGLRATHISRALLGMGGNSQGPNGYFSVAELIGETLAVMARDPKRDCIEFSSAVPAELQIAVPKVELQQVLLNLMLNARHAVMQKHVARKIELSAQVEAETILLKISDNGIGIPESNLPYIFEPFFTTKNTKSSQEEGNGLGLPVCREILQAMNGSISVQSQEGLGTTFTLKLPKAA